MKQIIENTKCLALLTVTALCGLSNSACNNADKAENHDGFTSLNSKHTNISFNNKLEESDSVNVFTNEYMYNGSGVGIADFNNDNLPDIFFCGSMQSSRLYINKGNFKFEDVTEQAGLITDVWCTGASAVDINHDGYMDIYVCASHSTDAAKRKNMLFINDGNLHFTNEAEAYGLADTGFSSQAAFFDYDKDGDLDMYLLNHRLYNPNPNNLVFKDTSGNSPAQDVLYRNDGVQENQTKSFFTNVSREAGIKEDGYGLGIVITDVNNDNWPDVYVANDYIGNDLLWLNNKNGTFSDIITKSVQHQSFNSMGVDAADINNDGLPDIAVLDMLPETNERKKAMFSGSSQERYDMERRFGYAPAFVRNVLQLNNGIRADENKQVPFYSEIGQLAGISETDWSWSVLMADFDNDGWKDIHVTNGLAKDVTNNDYVAFKNSQNVTQYTFSNSGASLSLAKQKANALLRENLDQYGSIKVSNYLFKNNGDLTFRNVTTASHLDIPSMSNGAAYADLDNDGDLDLVVNNINTEAFVFRNEARQSIKDSTNNFIAIQLKGTAQNPAAFGAKITLFNNGVTQFAEQSPVRGYSSSVDPRIHFGIGNATRIDSIRVLWPDNTSTVITKAKANQLLVIDHEAKAADVNHTAVRSAAFFSDITTQAQLIFEHKETQFFDFGAQRGVPQKFSQLGPCIARGDVNGDGLIDVFVGGAAQQSGKIFLQQNNGSFIAKDLVEGTKLGEDLGAVFFDSDGDNDLDLLITGGSPEYGSMAAYNKPRLYINNGKGNFTLNADAIPATIAGIAQAVAVADYDNDGDDDIFIGGRVVPGQYPASPESYIVRNNHGTFENVTQAVCPALAKAGMITAALWNDFDNDGQIDLVVCGDWMPVRFFKNTNRKLEEVTTTTSLTNMHGLWRSLLAVDIDRDGDMDFVAGNMGINNRYHLGDGRPMWLYAKDLDGNGIVDLIPSYYITGNDGVLKEYPGIDRNMFAEAVPSVKKKYLYHADFARVTMQQLLSDYGKEGWTMLKCDRMESVWIENLGNGKFKSHTLPKQAQFAPVNAIESLDVNHDGNPDLVFAGNEYQTDVVTGRYDASYGQVLLGNGKGGFTSVGYAQSGLVISGDVKALQVLSLKNQDKILLAAINNEPVRCFAIQAKN